MPDHADTIDTSAYLGNPPKNRRPSGAGLIGLYGVLKFASVGKKETTALTTGTETGKAAAATKISKPLPSLGSSGNRVGSVDQISNLLGLLSGKSVNRLMPWQGGRRVTTKTAADLYDEEDEEEEEDGPSGIGRTAIVGGGLTAILLSMYYKGRDSAAVRASRDKIKPPAQAPAQTPTQPPAQPGTEPQKSYSFGSATGELVKGILAPTRPQDWPAAASMYGTAAGSIPKLKNIPGVANVAKFSAKMFPAAAAISQLNPEDNTNLTDTVINRVLSTIAGAPGFAFSTAASISNDLTDILRRSWRQGVNPITAINQKSDEIASSQVGSSPMSHTMAPFVSPDKARGFRQSQTTRDVLDNLNGDTYRESPVTNAGTLLSEAGSSLRSALGPAPKPMDRVGLAPSLSQEEQGDASAALNNSSHANGAAVTPGVHWRVTGNGARRIYDGATQTYFAPNADWVEKHVPEHNRDSVIKNYNASGIGPSIVRQTPVPAVAPSQNRLSSTVASSVPPKIKPYEAPDPTPNYQVTTTK